MNYLSINTWDVISSEMSQKRKVQADQIDFNGLEEMKIDFGWKQLPFELLTKNFDALVVTDKQQVIQWVSKGFEQMTGYLPSEAIGRRPKFLQGPATCELTKAKIRKALEKDVKVKGAVLNYKKSGSPYLCAIEIFPMLNRDQNITHYMAIEREIENY